MCWSKLEKPKKLNFLVRMLGLPPLLETKRRVSCGVLLLRLCLRPSLK
jgi:hypothetical protein